MSEPREQPTYRIDLLGVADPVTGTREKIGRIPAKDFKLTKIVGKPLTLTMRVDNADPYVSAILEYATFLKVYRVPSGTIEGLSTVVARFGPSAYWRCNDAAGDPYLADAAGGGQLATAVGTYTKGFDGVTGETASAIDLNGSSGAVKVPTFPALHSTVFSFVGFVQPDTVAAGTATIAWNVGETSGGWKIHRSGADLVVTTYNGTTPTTATVAGVFTANTWSPVLVTYDGTTLTVNGTTFARTMTAKVGTSENSLFKLGAGGAGTTYNNFFDGTLDEIAVYERCLETAQTDAIEAAMSEPRDRRPAGAVVFHGPIAGPVRDLLGVDGRCELTAFSARHYVDRRHRQTTATYTTEDTVAIAESLLDDEDTRRSMRVTIPTGSTPSGIELDTFEATIGRNVGELLDELGAIGDGFEIDETFIDSDTGDMSELALVPTVGVTNTDVFLELETRLRNLKSATITSDPTRTASNLMVIGRTDDPASPNVVNVANAGVEDAYDALLDTVDTYGEVADPIALEAIGERLATYRTGPRRILTVESSGTLEFCPFDDFDIGDVVSCRTTDVDGRLVVDGSVRLWGFTVAVNAEAEERLEKIMIDASEATA